MPRTTLGGIVTSKETAGGHNRVAGVDFLTRFWSSSSLFLWGAKVWDSELAPIGESRTAGQAELVLQNDRYLFEVTRTHIGDAFLRATTRPGALGRASPVPAALRAELVGAPALPACGRESHHGGWRAGSSRTCGG